jgi:hypothetical protein
MASEIEKLVKELTRDALKELELEAENPFTKVRIELLCIVELPREVVNRLEPKIDLG